MKLLLTITSGTLSGRVFDLETGFLTIGRGENCSVRFDPVGERIASKQHAFIEAKADGYYLTDNASTNGTILNGERIEKSKIKTGDNVQFGKNGVTALITIQEPPAGHTPPPEVFRQEQIQQFNQIAQVQPDNFQNSMSNIGLGSIQAQSQPEPEKKTGKYFIAALAIFTAVFLSLVVIVLISSALSPSDDGEMTLNLSGVITAFLASFVAFIPAVIYILPLIWLDRYDPEPLWLLALAFAWGALVAVIVSFVINTSILYAVFALTNDPNTAQAVSGIISAPIFEEASKGIGVLILLIFFRRYFDDILDGIVFAGVIALGFATVENVLYYGRSVSPVVVGGAAYAFPGVVSLILSFILRGILSPFAHVTFTAMTGIGCGIARESHNKAIRIIMPILGYFAAVFLHFAWNFTAFIFGLGTFLLGYLFLGVPFFLIFSGFALYIMYRQNKILKEMLAIDVAQGLIPKIHADTATSAFKSTGWLIGGLFGGKFRARSRYMRAIGKLGLSYWHIQRATAAQGQTGSFQQNPILREEVLKWRDKV